MAFRVVVIDSTDWCTGYAAVGCFLLFMLRKLEDKRIVFHFDRSKPLLTHLLLFLGRYVNFQGLFPWSSIYQLKTRERITCTRLHDWQRILGKYELNCARRIEILQFLVFVLKLVHDFHSCCICVGLTVFIVFRQARLCVSLIVAFCSMF